MAMPLGHGRETRELRPLARREKLLAGGVAGVAALVLAVLLIVSLTRSDPRSGHGCVAISLAYSMGGTQTYRCGAGARRLCAGASAPGGHARSGTQLRDACRRAGLAVG